MMINVLDHHAVEHLLDDLQGTSRARALSAGDIATFAKEAESELEALGVPLAERKGCMYSYLPVPYTTRKNASKASRADATWIHLRREADGWYLVFAERLPRRMTSVQMRAGQLWITPAVHQELVQMFARSFHVLS